MSNMSGLSAACNVSDSKPMQFPLTQRRKRRVLFTQAQVSKSMNFFQNILKIDGKNCLVLKSSIAIDQILTKYFQILCLADTKIIYLLFFTTECA